LALHVVIKRQFFTFITDIGCGYGHMTFLKFRRLPCCIARRAGLSATAGLLVEHGVAVTGRML